MKLCTVIISLAFLTEGYQILQNSTICKATCKIYGYNCNGEKCFYEKCVCLNLEQVRKPKINVIPISDQWLKGSSRKYKSFNTMKLQKSKNWKPILPQETMKPPAKVTYTIQEKPISK